MNSTTVGTSIRSMEVGDPSAVAMIAAMLLALHGSSLRANEPSAEAVQASLDAGLSYLAAAQRDDGAWHSETYGVFRSGAELTPFLGSLWHEVPASPLRTRVVGRIHAHLTSLIDANGDVREGGRGLAYPVFTAAHSVICLPERPRTAFLRLVRREQYTADHGWRQADATWGGWGYGYVVPRPPTDADRVAAANLTATRAALLALQAARVPADDPALQAARQFVCRCQNFAPDLSDGADGGFFFSPTDTIRNKAGATGPADRPRPVSYGTCTADGLRSLALTGVGPADPRFQAALAWWDRHFTAHRIPGQFVADREPLRDSYFFYYVATAAQTCRLLLALEIDPDRQRDRLNLLVTELLRRQDRSGSWSNPDTDGKENDPLVATPMALEALLVWRAASRS